ncbi:hypothetical protein ACFQT0_21425 [Hymenobacter humi]|uniref:Uncharacterized protein n=1 Tax=Hymenobacter humi TaxID=1411620 RepID=A0ABW2UBQ2_9BACT
MGILSACLAERPAATVLSGRGRGGAGPYCGLFFRTQYLNATYQSELFLATARPITDPDTLHNVLYSVRRSWLPEYGTEAQYYTLAVCGVLLLVYGRRTLRHHLPLAFLLLAVVVLGYVFVQLMGAQFMDHDYYIICPLIPPALLLLVVALLNVGQYAGTIRYVTTVGLGALVFFSLADGYERLQRRMSDDYLPFSPFGHVWMRGGAAEMTQANVPLTANILVFKEPAPNLSLVYFNRRGRVWYVPDAGTVTAEDFLNRMAADQLDYLVMAPGVYAQLAPQHAALAAGFKVVGQHPAMVLRRRNLLRPW